MMTSKPAWRGSAKFAIEQPGWFNGGIRYILIIHGQDFLAFTSELCIIAKVNV